MNYLVCSIDRIVESSELVPDEIRAETESCLALEVDLSWLECSSHRSLVDIISVENERLCRLTSEDHHLILTELKRCVWTSANKVLVSDLYHDPVLLSDRKSVVAAGRVSPEHRCLATVEHTDH